ncbi:MAG: NAD(P)-dependent oxidoreductase [Patescibacteria group bacterium]|jgi:dTDP-4-dehydrorhamnose reductase
MKILLFGASGRLGTAMQRVLSHHEYLTPNGREVDLTNPEIVAAYVATHPVDFIINCAAYNDVNGAEQNPDLANTLNGYAPGFIAKAAALQNIPFIHFSTDYVFDGNKTEGYGENDVPNPESAYAESKRLGEMETLEKNPKSYVIRTSRLYGEPGAEATSKKSFVEIIVDLAKEKSTFDINASEVSAPTLVDDIAHHIETYIFPLPTPGIYHMANQGGCTWFEWATAIVEILKLPVTITPRDPSLNIQTIKKPAHSILLSTKIPPMRPWREALENFLLSHYVQS